jgi:AmmeMemoRadiSam system protein B
MRGDSRPPAVAGSFYPADPAELEQMVRGYLSQVETSGEGAPKALIAPHAGYVYSGPVAASAYARLAPARGRVSRVVLLGPSHRVALRGLAAPDATTFVTPLGEIALDREALERALTLPQVRVLHAAHELEHSLEVHLPFLQVVLGSFSLVPLVAGDASAADVAEVLELLWGGDETLVVVSSDLSHYKDYATAKRLDDATTRAVESLTPEAIGFEDACGRVPIRGLLEVARARGLTPVTLDVRSSGDTAGPRDRVVGYGSWSFA